MSIARNNYELYFIDYFEGNLNREEKEELLHFLSYNPDLKNEFDEFEKNFSPGTEVGFKFKNNLKKQIGDLEEVNNDTIDEYSIAYLENDLDEAEKAMLLNVIRENTDFEKTFNLYQRTKLQPDESIKYLYKSRLKHFAIERKFILRIVGYASAAAVIIGGLLLFNPAEEEQHHQTKLSEAVETKVPHELKVDLNNYQDEGAIVIEEKDLRLNSLVPENLESVNRIKNESRKSEDYELIWLEKLEPKNISFVHNSHKSAELQVKRVYEKSNTTRKFAENKIQPVKETYQEVKSGTRENKGLSLWGIAETGLKIFYKLNEKNIDLEPVFTSSGQLKSVTIITEQRKITTPAI